MGLGLTCTRDLRKERSHGWRFWSPDWWRGYFEVPLASFPLSSAISVPFITGRGQLGPIYQQLLESGAAMLCYITPGTAHSQDGAVLGFGPVC